MKNCINYNIITQAISYYQNTGFEYIDVDWTAPLNIVRITTPQRCRLYKLNNETSLVGSAEQSFLDLIINKKLKPSRYVAASPCFRDDENDDLHSNYFFKVELIDFENPTMQSLQEIIQTCKEFFELYLPVEVIQTEINNWDIVDAKYGIELGSYGIREYETVRWIYATGVAEPRLTTVLAHQ